MQSLQAIKVGETCVYKFKQKIFYLICIGTIVLVSFAGIAYAENGYIEIDRNDAGVFSLNIQSVEDRGDHAVGWCKIIIRKHININGGKAERMMVYVAAKKKRREIKTLSVAVYDKDGYVLDSCHGQDTKWEPCIPGSFGEKAWDAIITTNNFKLDKGIRDYPQ